MEQDKRGCSFCLEVQRTLPDTPSSKAAFCITGKDCFPALCLSTCRSRALSKLDQRRNFCFLLLLGNDHSLMKRPHSASSELERVVADSKGGEAGGWWHCLYRHVAYVGAAGCEVLALCAELCEWDSCFLGDIYRWQRDAMLSCYTPLRVGNKGRDEEFSWLICVDLNHPFSMK